MTKRTMTDITSFPRPGEVLKEVVHGPMAQYLTAEQKMQNRALADKLRKEKAEAHQRQLDFEAQKARERRMLYNSEINAAAQAELARREELARKLRKQELYQESFTNRFLNKIKDLPKVEGVDEVRAYFNTETEFLLVLESFKEPDLSFDWLCELSKALCTRKINFLNVSEEGGCETCGHGSNWIVRIKCSNCVI